MDLFLEKIARLTAERLSETKTRVPLEALKDYPLFSRQPQPVLPAFLRDDCNIIAEIKFASPSDGDICNTIDPRGIAKAYLDANATMLSVLTEPQYFKGSLAYLRQIREENPKALLLRKDFIVDPYQLTEARAYGADAALLIVAMAGVAATKELFAEAHTLGLTPLVEVHDEEELAVAIDMGADFIGVNNRNLKTLKISLDISRRLSLMKPENVVFICESGLSTAVQLREMRELGYDGFLMGTAFMKQSSPGAALAALKKEFSCA
jgi:indole-3-glycerol phosphate synthase